MLDLLKFKKALDITIKMSIEHIHKGRVGGNLKEEPRIQRQCYPLDPQDQQGRIVSIVPATQHGKNSHTSQKSLELGI